MIIKNVHIKKFRKFQDINFDLGKNLTAIVGQNGTQKTTLLAFLAQPFSCRDNNNPITKAKTIDGKKFESKLKSRIHIDTKYEKSGEHEWTIFVDKNIYDAEKFTVKSINRTENGIIKDLRFWNAAGREAGDGYIQLPVIYLSLSRLTSIGEDKKIQTAPLSLSQDEKQLFSTYHNKILCLDDEFSDVDYLKSPVKNTLAPKSVNYSPLSISAGQDNIGKILLSILSFKRLKEEYPDAYKGGILLIDELDATLFPAAQEQLIKILFYFSSKLNLQIIFTTHSYNILEVMKQQHYSFNSKLLYLMNLGDKIVIDDNASLDNIDKDLRLDATPSKSNPITKIRLYTEDREGMIFVKRLLERKINSKLITYMDNITLGCKNYKELIRKRIPEFKDNIIILDGDEDSSSSNIVILPKKPFSPEQLLYDYLKSLDASHEFWDNSVGGYKKQVCFKDYPDKPQNRTEYKQWFKSQEIYWGKGCKKLFTQWKKDNIDEVDKFIDDFINAYNIIAKTKKIPSIDKK